MKYWILLKKEFKETIRDKSVLISNFLFPLLSLPMIAIFGVIASGIISMNVEESKFKVWIVGNPPKEFSKIVKSNKTIEVTRHNESEYQDETQIKQLLKKDKVDVLIFTNQENERTKFRVISDSSKTQSYIIANKIKDSLNKFATFKRKEKIKSLGLKEADLSPIVVESKDYATLMDIAAKSFGGQTGIVMVILLIVGMYYPAINAFIGEKDKKTLNVLIFAADDENKIVLSKYVNIVIFGLLTFVPYILDYVIIKALMGKKLAGAFTATIDPKILAIMGVNVLVISLVLGAMCIIISILSKTMTRAQSFLSGIFMLLMIPIIFLNIVKSNMTLGMAMIPIMNFFYLARDLALNQVAVNNSIISIFVNLVFVVILLKFALGAFKKRHVLKV